MLDILNSSNIYNMLDRKNYIVLFHIIVYIRAAEQF